MRQTLDQDGFELLKMLKWQFEMGADASLLDTPIDRTLLLKTEEQETSKSQPLKIKADSVRKNQVQSSQKPQILETTQRIAQSLASKADSLDTLKDLINTFDDVSIKATATRLVFGEGPESLPADVMIIGEAPGREEDKMGRPFVGASGQLLDEILNAAGLARFDVSYITNILPWWPPGNRTPSDFEVAAFLPFCLRHIELVSPKLIMTLGGVSTKALLDVASGITRLRGKPQPISHSLNLVARQETQPIQVMPTFHPSYLLRNPIAKREVWSDMLEARLMLDQL